MSKTFVHITFRLMEVFIVAMATYWLVQFFVWAYSDFDFTYEVSRVYHQILNHYGIKE